MTSAWELKSASGLALLGLLLPLLLLYLLKARRERRMVPSAWLWTVATHDASAARPFRRLLAQVPLVLEATALLLLALGMARPSCRSERLAADHVALVVDTSASMGALTAAGTPRMTLARDAARRLLSTLPPATEVLLIDAGAQPFVVAPLERDRRRLSREIGRLAVREVEGVLERALSLGFDRLGGLAGENLMVVVTDQIEATLPDQNPLPVKVITVGSPTENTALVRVDVRSSRDPNTRREQVQAFGLIGHYGRVSREVSVAIRQENVAQPLASRRLRLRPGSTTPVVLTFDVTAADYGTGLVLELTPPDAMPVDDRAYGRVPPSRKLPVLLASREESTWLTRALSADPEVELFAVPLDGLASASGPKAALVMADGACPEQLPSADWLIVNPPPGRCHGVLVGEKVAPTRITSWFESDPRLRFVSLDGVEVLEAHALVGLGPREALVQAGETSLMADVSSPAGTKTLLAFDLANSNWPLKASFVVFVRNLVELAREHRIEGAFGNLRSGEPLRLRVPSGVDRVRIEDPHGKISWAAAHDGLALASPPDQVGIHFASWQGAQAGSVTCPVNLTSAKESDLWPAQRPVPTRAEVSSPRRSGPKGHVEWGWLFVALGLLLVALDIAWLTKRRALGTLGGTALPAPPERDQPQRVAP